MASRIVALSGTAGSGKSEVAKHLVQNYGFELVKFYYPLKTMLAAYYMTQGLVKHEDINSRIEGDLKEVPDPLLGGQTPRHAMQTIGTEWGRDCMGNSFWIDAWERRVERIGGPVVVDDCRFENEAEAVRALDGDVVLLRPKVRRRKASKHVAETGLDPSLVDHVVENDSTIEVLNHRVVEFIFDH